jgi:hypothetical protein
MIIAQRASGMYNKVILKKYNSGEAKLCTMKATRRLKVIVSLSPKQSN